MADGQLASGRRSWSSNAKLFTHTSIQIRVTTKNRQILLRKSVRSSRFRWPSPSSSSKAYRTSKSEMTKRRSRTHGWSSHHWYRLLRRPSHELFMPWSSAWLVGIRTNIRQKRQWKISAISQTMMMTTIIRLKVCKETSSEMTSSQCQIRGDTTRPCLEVIITLWGTSKYRLASHTAHLSL